MSNFVSRAELAGYLGIGDGQDDLRLDAALAAASQSIRNVCGRDFSQAAAVSARVFAPHDNLTCWVDDISTATGLLVATDDDLDGSYETSWTIATDFVLGPANGVVDGIEGYPATRLRAVGSKWFLCGSVRDVVQVTAKWGWAAVPDPVKQACWILAADLYKRKDAPFGVAGFGDLGVLRIRNDPVVAAMLEPYSRSVSFA